MYFSEVKKFYSREGVRKKLVTTARDREVVPMYKDKMGERPDTLMFKEDVSEFVKKGATSFHASMERWRNPNALTGDISSKEMDEKRKGWDLVIDIDSPKITYAKPCAKLICEALSFHGIENYSVKFSGGTGFHVGVPFEAFPKKINDELVRKMFPKAPRIIASYLRNMIENHLRDRILSFTNLDKISETLDISKGDLIEDGKFDPYSFLEIDTVAISNRHLFRMPYSFNEKTWLVSVPISESEIKDFRLEDAKYENVDSTRGFLDEWEKGEAKRLFTKAFDWKERKESERGSEIEKVKEGEFDIPEKALPKKFFPPCIKSILEGLEDGRKRSVFILINFLRSVGWDYNSIEKEVKEWNQRNEGPLRESYLKSQLTWHKNMKKKYLPPRCDNENYYKDIGVCEPDNLCKKIKNPIVYPLRKANWKGKKDSKSKEKK